MITNNRLLMLCMAGICCSIGIIGCSEYLDIKPNKRFATLQSLKVLQATLDYYPDINNRDAGSGEVSADNYYLPNTTFNALTEERRRIYIWEKDYFFSGVLNDWTRLYGTIYAANSVIDNIRKIDRTTENAVQWDDIMGQALFIRGKCFLDAVGIWGLAYDDAESFTDLGIPLRLEADFNIPSVRSTVKESYEQVLEDLQDASAYLPESVIHVMRPSKAAALALLSRTYLFMRKYDLALRYADSCLAFHNRLIDYNGIDETSAFPIPLFNEEVIYHSQLSLPYQLSQSRAKIDTVLFDAYNGNDLRKKVFFRDNGDGSYAFKGSYCGSSSLFSGVSANEIYLILAECYCRLGNHERAREYLSGLLERRYAMGTVPPTAKASPEDLLGVILDERRKELLMRGIRWMDIKRLNKEGRNIVLKREVNGETYELLPNNSRYALPLPEDVLDLSGMQQNPRE